MSDYEAIRRDVQTAYTNNQNVLHLQPYQAHNDTRLLVNNEIDRLQREEEAKRHSK